MEKTETSSDIILIGAGVMSATLGAILKEVAPEWKITVYEKLSGAGEESSNEWNNAGTGHAALCELNYTSEKADGTIDISKAIKINEQFQISKQFWSYLVHQGYIEDPKSFIMPLPHMSIVHGDKNEQFLKKRFEAMSKHPFFSDMEYTTDHDKLKTWFPLIMNGRQDDEVIAATKINSGTDVNFGALTRQLITHLEKQHVAVKYNHQVLDFKKLSDGRWEVKTKDLKTCKTIVERAKFVFIGGGGASLPLLQKTGIAEGKSIGGFPVSGLFLVCNNPDVVNEHHAKVYGKAKVGAPPMSVPHLDTRFIDNKKTLLFGPFAGFTPRFLKTGSLMDLLKSVKPHNVLTMLAAGVKEMSLTKYLVQQVLLSQEKRIEELREFIPHAKSEDWSVIIAGQRVQVIKDTTAGGKGTLQFGTEVVSAADGSVAALLGASPGASTAVSVMLEVIEKCFPKEVEQWTGKLKEMIPSYKISLEKNEELQSKLKAATDTKLQLND